MPSVKFDEELSKEFFPDIARRIVKTYVNGERTARQIEIRTELPPLLVVLLVDALLRLGAAGAGQGADQRVQGAGARPQGTDS